MVHEIRLAAFSPTMTAGNLIKWHVVVGQAVAAGAVLAEVEADKSTIEVTAAAAGVVTKLLVAEGTEGVPVDSILAIVDPDGISQARGDRQESLNSSAIKLQPESVTRVAVAARDSVVAHQSVAVPHTRSLAQKMALQAGIDLARFPKKENVTRAEVEALLSSAEVAPFSPPVAPSSFGNRSSFDLIPLSAMRRTIARRLTESKQTIPHFYMSAECRVDSIMAFRKTYNATVKEEEKLSLNDLILKAVATALHAVPDANAEWSEAGIKRYHAVDLAVAVALEQGLVTPILRDANKKGLRVISREMKDLIARARAGKLKPEDYQGGTFTVSNLGMYGITEFQAVINPPQAGILAVGKAMERPVVNNGVIEVATVMTVTLSADHRVIDGSVGALFLSALQTFIEQPLTMLID